MTCIAAARELDGTIVMGGDGASSDSGYKKSDTQAKVFEAGGFIIGSSGTHRTGQIARYLFEPPPIECKEVLTYMVKKFIPELQRLMREHGVERKTQDGTELDGRFLVGIRGRIFEIDSGYGVFEPSFHYHAIGCAGQVAVVAMFALTNKVATIHEDPGFHSGRRLVQKALEAAAEFDLHVREPFHILQTKPYPFRTDEFVHTSA